MAATGIHISLSAEPLFELGGFAFTNSMVTSLMVSGLLIAFALAVRLSFDPKTTKPRGLQNFAELIIEGLYSLTQSVAGSKKKTRQFFPFVATFFLFIILNNYFGLLPGVGTVGVTVADENPTAHAEETTENHEESVSYDSAAENIVADELAVAHEEVEPDGTHATKFVPIIRPGTADINTTLALAIVSMSAVQFFGVSHLGMHYFQKFFNFSDPINFYVGILEFISEFAKVISFAFRLFGNIFAGEVLLVVVGSLMPLIAPMPFYGLELFVGFIQALVFAMLSLVFFNMATHSHGE